MNPKPLYDRFQKLLIKTGEFPLTIIELDELLQEITGPELILFLIIGLKNNKILADQLLIKSISNSRSEEDLLPVALSLRFGANSNLYINVENIGIIHIFGYTYLFLQGINSPVINAIIIMLKEYGAKNTNPAFISSKENIKLGVEIINIKQWLFNQNFITILSQIETNYDNVQPSFLTKIGSLIDKPNMIITPISLSEIIKDHSTNVIWNNLDKIINYEYPLHIALKYLNLTAFEIFLDQGIIPDYIFINLILLEMKKFYYLKDDISYIQIKEMLEASIIRGIQLDQEQFSLLSSIDKNTANNILVKYTEPYW